MIIGLDAVPHRMVQLIIPIDLADHDGADTRGQSRPRRICNDRRQLICSISGPQPRRREPDRCCWNGMLSILFEIVLCQRIYRKLDALTSRIISSPEPLWGYWPLNANSCLIGTGICKRRFDGHLSMPR
jgi:hypothetical protein